MSNFIKNIKKVLAQCNKHAKENDVAYIKVVLDHFWARLVYGFSSEDYFLNSTGITMSNLRRRDFLSAGHYDKLVRVLNCEESLSVLNNKVEFLTSFSNYIHRKWIYPRNVSFDEFKDFVSTTPKIIAKPLSACGGEGVKMYESSSCLENDYIKLKEEDYLLEEYVVQHKDMSFNNASLNTVRVYSVLDSKGDAHIIKAILRAGCGDSVVDNYHSGGVIYPINVKYGIVEEGGVNRFNQNRIYIHPGSNQLMLGFCIPNWNKVIDIVSRLSKKLPKIRYIGWDIAITEKGVEVIEANCLAERAFLERIGSEHSFYPKIKQYL